MIPPLTEDKLKLLLSHAESLQNATNGALRKIALHFDNDAMLNKPVIVSIATRLLEVANALPNYSP